MKTSSKGIWIPEELLQNEELTIMEKLFLIKVAKEIKAKLVKEKEIECLELSRSNRDRKRVREVCDIDKYEEYDSYQDHEDHEEYEDYEESIKDEEELEGGKCREWELDKWKEIYVF